jgi:hypothetical protein
VIALLGHLAFPVVALPPALEPAADATLHA